jgi:hypothetical protein
MANHTGVHRVPVDIEKDFRRVRDDRTGDFSQFHLYCEYRCGTASGLLDRFEWCYKISGTKYAVAKHQGMTEEVLEQKWLSRESAKFRMDIERRLCKDGKRLTRSAA